MKQLDNYILEKLHLDNNLDFEYVNFDELKKLIERYLDKYHTDKVLINDLIHEEIRVRGKKFKYISLERQYPKSIYVCFEANDMHGNIGYLVNSVSIYRDFSSTQVKKIYDALVSSVK